MPETLPLWISMAPLASPFAPLSEQGEARIYCDTTTMTLWLSVNGSAYAQIAGAVFSEAVAAGFTPKLPVSYATAGALPTGTYNNGTGGVGATFTVTAAGYLTVDTKRVAVNDSILVKNQASNLQNGVYVVTQTGKTVQTVLTRRTDSDSGAELLNAFYAIIGGSANKNKQFYCSDAAAPTVGTDPITFALFAPVGGGGSGGITAGAGLAKAGNVMSLSDADLVATAADSLLGNNTGAPIAPISLSIADVTSLLGLDTAAFQPTTAFDAAGAAAAALTAAENYTDTAVAPKLSAPVANASLANMAAKTFKGRHTNSTGAPEDVAAADVLADIGALTSALDGLTAKTTPADADETVIADSAATFAAKKLTLANLLAYAWKAIAGLTGKTTPADADTLVISDSAASAVGKSLTWANVKATLKTYFDTLYGTIAQAKADFLIIAVSDESTAITTGTAKVTFRMPFAFTLSEVRASLNTASSSGNPAIDVNESGVSIFSTTLTIDSGETTSVTAATPAVISDANLADDAEMTVDIDTAGTGAKGLKLVFIGTRA